MKEELLNDIVNRINTDINKLTELLELEKTTKFKMYDKGLIEGLIMAKKIIKEEKAQNEQ